MKNLRKPSHRSRLTKPMGDNPMKTDTSLGNDTDVNRIVERFARTGSLPENPSTTEPQYGDITNLQGDLTELIEKGQQAKKSLQELKDNEKREQQIKNEKREKRLQYLEEQETRREKDLRLSQTSVHQPGDTPPVSTD